MFLELIYIFCLKGASTIEGPKEECKEATPAGGELSSSCAYHSLKSG